MGSYLVTLLILRFYEVAVLGDGGGDLFNH